MATGTRKVGEFCWFNMITPKPADAMSFFGRVLGWTFVEMPGVGHGVRVDGRDVGGLFDLDGPNTPPGTKTQIGVMVKVESADAVGERVRSLGGDAKPAFDVFSAGRMAVCADPNGAGFDIWEPKALLGTDVDRFAHGAPTWYETLTTDSDRAARFYADLFGWNPTAHQMPSFPYTTFNLGGEDVAGMMEIAPEMGGIRPHWRVNFAVADADETARLAVELGATLFLDLHDIPEIGRIGGITSPQGVRFQVIQYAAR